MKKNKIELTVAQKSFLDLEFLFPNMCVNNIHTILFFDDEISKINKAYNLVKKQNDVFELRLGIEGDKYFLYQDESDNYDEFETYDFTGNRIGYEKWLNEYQTQQLFVKGSALYHICIVITPDGEKGLSFLAHHMLHDAFSICLFFQQIIEAVDKGQICAKRYSYIDYILNRNNCEKDRELVSSYWREKIEEYDEDTIFKKDSSSLLGDTLEIEIPEELSFNIREYCKDNNVSIFMLFLGALFLGRSVYSQKTNLEIGVPILNRIGAKDKGTMGLYTNVLPLFMHFDLNMSVEEYLMNLRETTDEFYRHRYSSYEEIKKVYEVMQKKEPNLFDTLLSYQKVGFLHSEKFYLKWVERYRLVNPLLITIVDYGMGSFSLRYEYRKEKVEKNSVKEISDKFSEILNKIINSETGTALDNLIK